MAGKQPHPSIENWIKDLLSKALPIRTGPSALVNQKFLVLFIGHLHREQYESSSLTLFQLTAAASAAVMKPIVDANNSFHDY